MSTLHEAAAARRATSGTELDTLPVSEMFHRTIQGEGPAMGRPASFLRLMGCNLSCAWCDTPYTWDASRHDLRAETTHRAAPDLVAELVAEQAPLVVLTGGEPLIHQDRPAFVELVERLADAGIALHVETNGTIAPSEHLAEHAALIVVSPKLPHAGPHRGHQDPRVAEALGAVGARGRMVVKVVVRDATDVAAAVELADSIGVPRRRLWVMPEGRTVDQLARRWPVVAAEAARLGVNATHRLHVLAWGEERGR